jgi:four helix bundle protein
MVRSGTSVAANYRAACRARSAAEFVSKMGIVEEEADESMFWLEMLEEAHLLGLERLKPLMREANELVAVVVASRKTAKQNLARP